MQMNETKLFLVPLSSECHAPVEVLTNDGLITELTLQFLYTLFGTSSRGGEYQLLYPQ